VRENGGEVQTPTWASDRIALEPSSTCYVTKKSTAEGGQEQTATATVAALSTAEISSPFRAAYSDRGSEPSSERPVDVKTAESAKTACGCGSAACRFH